MISKMIESGPISIFEVDPGKKVSSVSLIFCNTDEQEDVSVDLYLVPQDKTTSDLETQIVKNFVIPKGDTMLWSTERFIMDQGYKLVQEQSKQNVVTCNMSYLEL